MLIPLALAVIFLILYLQFRRSRRPLVIYSAVLVAISGGFLLIWLYNQPWFLDFSVFGTSMRDLFQVGRSTCRWRSGWASSRWSGSRPTTACDDDLPRSSASRRPPESIDAIRERVLEAGLRRVRPCLMTTATTLLALLPVITSQGARSADVMVPMAIPAVGGMTIELITLFVVPLLYSLREEWRFRLDDDDSDVIEYPDS